MDKKTFAIFFASMMTLALLNAAVLAEDIYPPTWRGEPGTTWAEWEFLTNNPQPLPDQQYNPYGPSATFVYPGFDQAWEESWGGHQGVWPLSGVIYIDIPNLNQPNPYKDIWVQLTWATQNQTPFGNEIPYVSENITGAQGTLIHEIALGPTGVQPSPPLGDTWYHSTYLIHIEPNPAHEVIRISGGIMLDEVVIDTICIPEPAVCVMLALMLGSLLSAGAVRRFRG
jgi:hypothetical protein